MRIKDEFNPTEDELRQWAAEPGALHPTDDWELVLAWGMEPGRLRTIATLAADTTLPNARFFLIVLYTWVSWAARNKDFDSWRKQYDRWLDEVRGNKDPAVKQWRYRARRIFQGIDKFDYDAWWGIFAKDRDVAD